LRRLGILIAVLWLSLPSAAFSYDLLVVQSQRSPVYDEVLRGFRSAIKLSQRLIILSDYSEVDLQRIVREENPLVILTMGDNALAAARKLRQIPIISLMSLSYRAGSGGHSALTGVEVQIPPERYLSLFAAIKKRRVGIVVNTARNSQYVRKAQKLSSRYGVELVIKDVNSPKEVSLQLKSLAGTVDAVWMLPDVSTATGEAADAILLFAAGQRIPVVSFSSTYLSTGAAIAIEIDRFDLGKQGGEMAAMLIDGAEIGDVATAVPRKCAIKTNQSILRRLGLPSDIPSLRSGE